MVSDALFFVSGSKLGSPVLVLTLLFADAYCAYGSEGVVHAIKLLKDEMEMKCVLLTANQVALADSAPEQHATHRRSYTC